MGTGGDGEEPLRVAIVGAGLAGLSAGCELADRGHEVTLFEKRPWAGGKTYSFVDRQTGQAVDNGQHVFMACTTAYTDFLRRLGTLRLTHRQRRLHVPVFDGRGRRSDLSASALPRPLHLAASFARYRHIGLSQKVRVARAMVAAQRMSEAGRRQQHAISFARWLVSQGQSQALIERFWDFLVLPTLNCRSAEASAADALFVLREGFLKSRSSAAIGISRVGLSELHVAPAIRYLEQRGASVRVGTPVAGFDVSGQRVKAMCLDDGSRLAFDAYVLATPYPTAVTLLPEAVAVDERFRGLAELRTAPIVNLHFWFDRDVADFEFAAFLDSELQWVFNRGRLDAQAAPGHQHLVVSVSGAQRFMSRTKRELRDTFLGELRRRLPAAREANLVHFVAVKEPDATFVPAPGIQRPPVETPLRDFFLAGAYTDTGWPATMESAVRSGKRAAESIDSRRAELTPVAADVA